jgi:hypothetical protein
MPDSRQMTPADMPLSALLSQVLVAFTIEFDNEFEHQVPHRTTNHGSTPGAGNVPWLVSRVMWSNFLRFVDAKGTSIRELQSRIRMPYKDLRPWLTRLSDWWGYILVESKVAGSTAKRMHPDALVVPTPGGRRALEVWRSLDALVEKRWRDRPYGESIDDLREALSNIAGQIHVQLPESLPILGYGLFSTGPEDAQPAQASGGSLPSLLSKVLLWFAIAFEGACPVSLAISANVLRLLTDEGTPVRDLPRMAGVSKEATATSLSFLDKRGYTALRSKPGAGGKVLLLTAKGRDAQEAYGRVVWSIEQQWQMHFGEGVVGLLRKSLESLAGQPDKQRSPLFLGLDPYPDGWRASVPKPERLPHYPMVLHRGGFPDGS